MAQIKYSNTYHQSHERYVVRPKDLFGDRQNGGSDTHKPHETTKHKRFFRHPRFEIDKRLDRAPITIRTDGIMRSNGTRPNVEEFKANIWSFRVKNRNYFSTPADECSAQIKISNVSQYLNFTWRSNIPILENCHISDPTDEPPRQIYAKRLAYEYLIEHFVDTNNPTVDIQKDESYLLNLIFTFEDSEYAYFITPILGATWYGDHDVFYSELRGTRLLIPLGTHDFPIIIRFQWREPGSTDQYEYSDISGMNYKINANSWNNITMSRS